MAEALPGARARSAARRDAVDVEARAREILNRHCEYVDGLDRGQRIISTGNALAAVMEALSTALTSSREGAWNIERDATEAARTHGFEPATRPQSDRIEKLVEALRAIDQTAFIGCTTDIDEARRVALDSVHDIARTALNEDTSHGK